MCNKKVLDLRTVSQGGLHDDGMGTFAGTAKANYRLSLPNENKLPISVFRLRKTNRSLSFPFSVCSKQTESGDIRRECPSLESVRVAELELSDCLISYR